MTNIKPGKQPFKRCDPPLAMIPGALVPTKTAPIVPNTSREAGAPVHDTKTGDTLEMDKAAEKAFNE